MVVGQYEHRPWIGLSGMGVMCPLLHDRHMRAEVKSETAITLALEIVFVVLIDFSSGITLTRSSISSILKSCFGVHRVFSSSNAFTIMLQSLYDLCKVKDPTWFCQRESFASRVCYD